MYQDDDEEDNPCYPDVRYSHYHIFRFNISRSYFGRVTSKGPGSCSLLVISQVFVQCLKDVVDSVVSGPSE